jgi:transcriptional regulator with XRE-family HTH domain
MATLDDLITEAGLRKTELANETGLNAATITRIAHGEATSRVTVVKIVRVLEKYLNRSINIGSVLRKEPPSREVDKCGTVFGEAERSRRCWSATTEVAGSDPT